MSNDESIVIRSSVDFHAVGVEGPIKREGPVINVEIPLPWIAKSSEVRRDVGPSDDQQQYTFQYVKDVIDGASSSSDTYEELIGKEIPDTWVTDSFAEVKDPMVVVDVRDVIDENGDAHLAAILMRKMTTKNGWPVEIDYYEECDSQTETTARRDTMYFGYAEKLEIGATYNKNDVGSHDGHVYRCKAVASSITGFPPDVDDWADVDPSVVLGYGAVYLDLSEGALIPYNDYFKVFKTVLVSGYAQRDLMSSSIKNWQTSKWRKYLNDQQGPSNSRSYKSGCSSDLLNHIRNVKISCGDGVETVDSFWLPFGIEVGGKSSSGNLGRRFIVLKSAGSIDANRNPVFSEMFCGIYPESVFAGEEYETIGMPLHGLPTCAIF